jgi:(1->4)-alpha-D-glucan 1-alpha-D-glucosylmutase
MADSRRARSQHSGHRVGASVPTSTYRVQLTADFTFADVAEILPYLNRLGVSHVYLSPILEATPGSAHFYDVVDHTRISEALGGEAGLRDLAWRAGELGMGLIADIVPNHMAVPVPAFHNRALWSVLEFGAESPYARWFDVDWGAGEPVLMAVLGSRIGTALARGELSVDAVTIPWSADAPTPVLRYFDHVFPLREGTENLPLEALVEQQHYRLAYWRVGNEELNYRRFFDVGTLVGLRVEDPEVFDATHRLIVELVRDGTLAGLRVDHPDGLADPGAYLERLSEATDGAWIVVEKILEDDEQLPSRWRTAGTTGYDASWRIGAALREPGGAMGLAGTLQRVAGDGVGDLPRIIAAAKQEIIDGALAPEAARLASLAHGVCTQDIRLRDHTWRALHDCFRAMLVAMPRYRAYVSPGEAATAAALEVLDAAATRARPELDPERHETLEVVVDLLKGNEVGSAGKTAEAARTELITRFQQVCGAVMAKGVEDTAYYRWMHLLPLCEVGSPASRFALPTAALHAWAAERQLSSPHALTSLTTHDTKRSGDIRARLGVLSELPQEWDAWVSDARAASADFRPAELDGRTELLWWQTLVGTVDHRGALMEWARLEAYMIKAMREAKTHTSWTAVGADYESSVLWFCQTTHSDPAVGELVSRWSTQTADAVRAAVLGQTLLHLTLPGIPDIFQGTETYAPLLVDPDNRRLVDFAPLHRDLEGATNSKARRRLDLAQEKLLVTTCALSLRRERSDQFTDLEGGYEPLASTSSHVIAFSRTHGGAPIMAAIATRAAAELERLGGWQDHTVQLPSGAWRDLLAPRVEYEGLVALASLLEHRPVALLVPA